MNLDTTFLPMALPLALALVVVLTGPGLIVARAVARWALPAPQARARAASLRFGLALATVLAALFALIDPQMGLMLTLCMVCLWLGLSDWTWRWLPLPWVLALWAAGLAHGWFEDAWIGPLIASLAVLACLFALQVSYQGVRGKEGLGTGDILFLGAIAGWIGLPDTFLVILAAA
ncbi:MAG: prepilin peptidase, partial [Pseudomonadota bacterium]